MKFALLSAFAVIVLSIFCSTVNAGDFATLNVIGFSKDGKYLAFEEYGVQDGSGFPYSNVYLIDVVKNSFASPAVKIRIDKEDATEQLARSRARLAAASALRRLGIVERNTGTLVVSRLLTDVTALGSGQDSDGKTQKINFAEVVGSMYRLGDYDLLLRSSDIKVKECDYTDQPVQKLELTLKDHGTDKTIVLQKDSTVPVSRSCPTRYEVQHVYLYQNHIAVFLNTYHQGFEGPDMRYLVVTGKYK